MRHGLRKMRHKRRLTIGHLLQKTDQGLAGELYWWLYADKSIDSYSNVAFLLDQMHFLTSNTHPKKNSAKSNLRSEINSSDA